MRFNILTFNNQVGIVTDAILLCNLIKTHIDKNVQIIFLNETKCNFDAEIGIWIQNFDVNVLNNFKKNIFFINEEWAGNHELNNLHLFDYVICKSQYAKNLLKDYDNITYIPFISNNILDVRTQKSNRFLHFMGRSIQKNTELVLKQSVPITLIDPYNRYKPHSNFTHINSYQTNESISNLLNSHNIHICCSLYESWGHYLFEGLSTGNEIICSDIPVFKENLDPNLVHFISTVEKTDDSYLYCSENKNNFYKFRKSFFVDENYLKNKIENFETIGKSEERRKLFNKIHDVGCNQIKNFLINM